MSTVALPQEDSDRPVAGTHELEAAGSPRFDDIGALVLNMDDAIIVADADARCVAVSPAVVALLGYTRDELLQMQILDLVDLPWAWSAAEFAHLVREQALCGEIELRRKDGSPVTVEARAREVQLPLGVVYVSTLHDISERRQAEAALRASQEQLQSIVETSPDMICILDERGRYRFLNSAYQRLLGYDPVVLLDMQPFDLLHPEDVPLVVARFEGLVDPTDSSRGTHGLLDLICRVRHADGHWVSVEARWRLLRGQDGQFAGVLVMSRDVTERRQLEEEHDRLLAQEQAARAEAEAALRVRDEFLSSISHELRTPLTTIKGFAQVLAAQAARLDIPERSRLVNGLAKIDANTRRMTALVDELLDLGRLEAGRPLALDPHVTDLVPLVQRVAAEHQKSAPRHRIVVETDVPALVGQWDAERMARALSNLLANAVKYSPGGGAVRIILGWDVDDGALAWASVAVQDEGIGIPEADLDRVFERFHRGTNVGAIWGTGVGLALVRQVVEQHGGTIAIASTAGVGTTVTIRLPLG